VLCEGLGEGSRIRAGQRLLTAAVTNS